MPARRRSATAVLRGSGRGDLVRVSPRTRQKDGCSFIIFPLCILNTKHERRHREQCAETAGRRWKSRWPPSLRPTQPRRRGGAHPNEAINLLVNDEAPSYSFDLAGRLIGAFVARVNYRRGLDNRVLCKWRRGRRRTAAALAVRAGGNHFLAGAYGLAEQVAEATGRSPAGRAARLDAARLTADAARFAEVYRPVSILPPDQYLALVLQATEGCSYNRCTFCNFYRDRPFRVKTPEELPAHIAAVRAFFGPALGLRKTLFLADANALVAPMSRLRAWLDVIEAETDPAASGHLLVHGRVRRGPQSGGRVG